MSGGVDDATIRCANCKALLRQAGSVTEIRQPCPICGSVNRLHEVELNPSVVAMSFITASPVLLGRTRAVLSDLPEGDITSQLREVGFLLKWDQLTEHGEWMLRIYRGDDLVDAAVAIDKYEALQAVAESLLP
jgi:phage FluMu protein Com